MNFSNLAFNVYDLLNIFIPENDGTVFINYCMIWMSFIPTSLKMEIYFKFLVRIVLKFIFNSVVSSLSPFMIYFLLSS